MIISLCSSNKVLICALELISPTGFSVLSTIFFSLGDCRKLIVSTVRVSDTKTKLIDVALSHGFPRSIGRDRQ